MLNEIHVLKNIEIDGQIGSFDFFLFPNDEPIEIGDYYLTFFGGVYDVQKCESELEKFQINKNDLKRDRGKIDLVSGFWRNCYKIKSTTLNLANID